MRLLRHLVPRNDGSGNVILTLSPDERKEPKGLAMTKKEVKVSPII